MPIQILLNLSIAIIWMLLSSHFSFSTFLVGYVIGLALLYLFKSFLKFDLYFTKIIAFVKLILVFIKEMIIANLNVAKIVLSPKLKAKPGIVAYPTELNSALQVTLLSSLITLTPGTLVMAFSDDRKTLYVHTIDIDSKEKVIESIKTTFEKGILEVTD
ncbi:Na(+)/H(+) antiporter subunit E [Paraliobacillus ryukyuensis]|uniref:Multisubunit sodium/proton antiporter MrpE subunit n=1 Tax=Paraliobacillus ryukyuensis TaxID=200904 RepID=A0A366DX12_9BACI|nr:Na+/H+ antiporter subunit E [Paraliobacillus ryukyuensis]RBO94602.1 multisubunit sodium/proton antiporter MrpE subunit [Paraliobacillus ryukyuensis]